MKTYRGVSEGTIKNIEGWEQYYKADRKKKYLNKLKTMRLMLALDWDKNFETIYDFSKTDEDCHQAMLMKWIKDKHSEVLAYAIPNGSHKSKAQRFLFQCTGILSGVGDIFIQEARQSSHGLFLELKTSKNAQSAAQKEFEQKCIKRGYAYCVTRDLKSSIDLIEKYLA